MLVHWLIIGTFESVAEPPRGIAPLMLYLPLKPKPGYINTSFNDREISIYRQHQAPKTEIAWRELTQLGTSSNVIG